MGLLGLHGNARRAMGITAAVKEAHEDARCAGREGDLARCAGEDREGWRRPGGDGDRQRGRPEVARHWPFAGLVSHKVSASGRVAPPVSTDAVRPLLAAPAFSVATAKAAAPFCGTERIPVLPTVAPSAMISAVGVAEKVRSIVLTPVVTGAGATPSQSKTKGYAFNIWALLAWKRRAQRSGTDHCRRSSPSACSVNRSRRWSPDRWSGSRALRR